MPRGRRIGAIIAATAGTSVGLVLLPLALDRMASDENWWAGIDFIRRYPWPAGIVLAVVAVGSSVWMWNSGNTAMAETAGTGTTTISSRSSQTVLGNYLDAGQGGQINVHLSAAAGDVPKIAPTTSRPVIIVFSKKVPLPDSIEWETAYAEAVADIQLTAQIRCLPASDEHLTRDDIDVLVIIYGAAHHAKARVEVVQTAAKCRQRNPSVRLVIVACSYSTPPLAESRLLDMIRTAGLGEPFDVQVIEEPSAFRDWVAVPLRLVTRLASLQEGWPRTHESSGEERTEGGD